MKKLFLVCALALTTVMLRAELINEFLDPIVTGIPSLMIAPDARAGGMGDVGAATRPDIFSQHWNPAKYAFMESPAGFAFSYTPWLSALVDDINLFYAAGFWRLDEFQAFSASIRYFSLGRIVMRQSIDDNTGMIANPNEFAIDLAYSRRLSEHFSASVAFRYIRGDLNVPQMSASDIPMVPANAFAVDVSAFYTRPITMASGDGILSFGANVSNIGNRITYDEMTYNFLPTNFRLGGSFDMPLDNFNRISINADVNKLLVVSRNGRFMQGRPEGEKFGDVSVLQSIFGSFNDGPLGERLMWSLGAEYAYNNQFFVRAGYFHEHPNQGGRRYFTAGAGFRLNVFELNAGYVIATTPMNPLDQTLRFSLSFDMDGLRNLMN